MGAADKEKHGEKEAIHRGTPLVESPEGYTITEYYETMMKQYLIKRQATLTKGSVPSDTSGEKKDSGRCHLSCTRAENFSGCQ